MELTPKQQAIKIIQESNNILLLTHSDPDGDAVGSLLAFQKVLERMGKKTTVVAPGEVGHALLFLPGSGQIQNDLQIAKESKIVVSEAGDQVQTISWKRIEDNKIELLVSGLRLAPTDVTVASSGFDFDAVIILDTASHDRLGAIWHNNADLFYELPTIAIDHHSSNSHFAKVNIVDMTAAATAEILVSIFEALGKSTDVVDADVATCLLAGLMTDTNNFLYPNTTPKALTVAAQLVAAGAKQQEIVKAIFNTNSLSTLRIWGRALAYIKEDRINRFIWSTLSRADYVASGADDSSADTSGIIGGLMKTAEGSDFVLLLKEKADGVHGSLRSISPNIDVSEIARLFVGGGHVRAAGFQIKDKKLVDVEMEIIAKIRSYCQQNLKREADLEITPPTVELDEEEDFVEIS